MANTIGFGQAAVNNTNGFGKAPTNNTIDFGEVCADSWSPETNLTGTGATPSYENEYSFQFDGIDDYIQTNSTYSELNGLTKASFSIWVKPIAGAPKLEYALSNPRSTTGNQAQFALVIYESNIVEFFINSRTSQRVTASISNINYGSWNHILVTIDLSLTAGSRGKMFINGSDVGTSAMGSTSSFYNATDVLYIGEEANNAFNPFNGNIDEVAIWAGTDLRSNASDIYNLGVPNNLNDNGLTAPTTWFRMGEAATFDGIRDWNLVDQGTGGNDATSQNIAETERVTDVPT